MLEELLETARSYQPTAIYWQGPGSGALDESLLEKFQQLPSKPAICNDSGDAFGNFWIRPYPAAYLQISRMVDISYSCGLGRAERRLRKAGVRHIHLLPNSYDDIRFGTPLDQRVDAEFDIVMIANLTLSRKPMGSFPGARLRARLARALSKRYGKRFALYGSGWPEYESALGPLPPEKQETAYQSARIAIGAPNFLDIDYYDSNRLLNAIGSGTPYVSRYSPKLEELFTDGKHCHFFRTVDESIKTIDRLLELPDSERQTMGTLAARHIRETHSTTARMEQVLDTLDKVWASKHLGAPFPQKDLRFMAAGD
jgi:spore maturation protein CgeB